MTEPGSGSDAFALRTRAEPDGSGYRINGTKTFISNGPVADLVIVFAMTDPKKGYHGGVTAFLVESSATGFLRRREVREDGAAHLADRRARVHRSLRSRRSGGRRGRCRLRGVHLGDGLGADLPVREPRRRDGAAAGDLDRLRTHAHAVRSGDREVPGRFPPHRRHEGAAGGGAPAHLPLRLAPTSIRGALRWTRR